MRIEREDLYSGVVTRRYRVDNMQICTHKESRFSVGVWKLGSFRIAILVCVVFGGVRSSYLFDSSKFEFSWECRQVGAASRFFCAFCGSDKKGNFWTFCWSVEGPYETKPFFIR